jgi:MFS superfamily sulfate permease-like transporter
MINWRNLSLTQKVATVVAGIAVILAVMGSATPERFPVNINAPCIALFTLCEAIINWNGRRKFSYVLIGAAVISMASFLLELSLS